MFEETKNKQKEADDGLFLYIFVVIGKEYKHSNVLLVRGRVIARKTVRKSVLSGACSIKVVLHILSPFCFKLQNCPLFFVEIYGQELAIYCGKIHGSYDRPR